MANRSTKNHWNVLSMKLQMSLESHLATDTTVILPQNRMDLSAVIWSKNDRSAGKTDGWQRRKHPVTHLSQCTKEKAGLCHGDLLFLLPESTNSFLKAVLPETASFSFAECDVRVLSVPGLPQELFLLLPKPPAAPPHPGKYPPAQIPDLHSAGYRKISRSA